MTIGVLRAGFCHGRLVAGPEAGPLPPPEAGRMSLRRNPHHGSGPMTVSQSASCHRSFRAAGPRCGGAGGSDRSLWRAPCICALRIRGGGASCSRERERVGLRGSRGLGGGSGRRGVAGRVGRSELVPGASHGEGDHDHAWSGDLQRAIATAHTGPRSSRWTRAWG